MKTPILRRLLDEQIFSVEATADGRRFEFVEECDRYFKVTLSAVEMEALIHELRSVLDGTAEETPPTETQP